MYLFFYYIIFNNTCFHVYECKNTFTLIHFFYFSHFFLTFYTFFTLQFFFFFHVRLFRSRLSILHTQKTRQNTHIQIKHINIRAPECPGILRFMWAPCKSKNFSRPRENFSRRWAKGV